MRLISLSHGEYRLELAPEVGGAIARLTWRGIDLLRPAQFGHGAASVLQMSAFPLAPFANRIAHGRFRFAGREVRLTPTLEGHPHPLHGHGWLAPWTVEAAAADRAVLGFTYGGGEWPWPYRARQTVALTDHGLSLRLSMTNLASVPAPAGLGFHPYFPDREQARLTAKLDGVWRIDADCLATDWQAGLPFGDWPAGAPVARDQLIDHCHTGWDGKALIVLPSQGLSLRLTASPELAWLHVYSPPGEGYFCVEPVSHRPDALNGAEPALDGLRVLAPGESLTVSIGLDVANS